MGHRFILSAEKEIKGACTCEHFGFRYWMLWYKLGNGLDVQMYGRNEAVVNEINESHTNGHYLKDVDLPAALRATSDLTAAVDHAELLVIAVPVKAVRGITKDIHRILLEINKTVLIV